MAVSSSRIRGESPDDACRTIISEIKAGKVCPVYLLAGEFPVTAPQVESIVHSLLSQQAAEMNLQELSGEDAVPGRCVEFLETRGFFPGRKVLLVRDPPFLHSPATAGAMWKRVLAALERKEYRGAGATLGRILGMFNLTVREVLQLETAEFEKALKWPSGQPVEPVRKFMEDQGNSIVPSAAGSGGGTDMLIRWIAETAKSETAVMIIQTEVIDRRSAVFKAIKRAGRTVDFLQSGNARTVKQYAASTVRRLFSEYRTTIEPGAVELLLDLVGDTNIPALMKEVEKLAAMVCRDGSGMKKVTTAHVRKIVSRQREEELYRLTGAIARQDMSAAVESLHRLLDQGIYPLAVLGTINNFIKKMIAVTAAALATTGTSALGKASFSRFRDQLLPELKKYYANSEEDVLKGHPYALYMQCREVGNLSLNELSDMLLLLPAIDLELKGGACDPRLVLDLLVIRMAGGGG